MLFNDKPVAVVFDFDKTLSPHYMQKPIFEHFGVEEKTFWSLSNTHARANSIHLGGRCFVEFEYMNTMIEFARNRIFKGLDNDLLSELGQKIEIYPGVEDLFYYLKGIGVEIYIVSSGIRAMIKDIPFVKRCVTEIFASDFADYRMDKDGNILPFNATKDKPRAIQTVARAVIPSDKTRIMNEISKGCKQGNFDPCIGLRAEERRIPFKRMIYVGDGISDIYAFDAIKNGGGYAVGVYNPSDLSFNQMEMIREDGWLTILGVADYRPDSTVGSWIMSKTRQLLAEVQAETEQREEQKLTDIRKHVPSFIHSWDGKGK